MRLVVCDDHRIFAESLAVALQSRGYTVLAVATTAAESTAVVTEHRPDICLLDLYLPRREDGLEVARDIRAHQRETKVLVLVDVADPLIHARAINLGVAGITRKDQTLDTIETALKQVGAGLAAFEAEPVHDVGPGRAAMLPRQQSRPCLTYRELEVLRRITDGENTTQIARAMQISSSTVRTHVQHVLTKLGVHSRLEATAIATRARLLDELFVRK
jgi:two-component system nitrate/nitrite response regulator NarL